MITAPSPTSVALLLGLSFFLGLAFEELHHALQRRPLGHGPNLVVVGILLPGLAVVAGAVQLDAADATLFDTGPRTLDRIAGNMDFTTMKSDASALSNGTFWLCSKEWNPIRPKPTERSRQAA